MRRSRISRETGRLTSALSSRRSLRTHTNGAPSSSAPDDMSSTIVKQEEDSSDNDFSPPPPESPEATPPSVPASSRKRKRKDGALDSVSPQSTNTRTPTRRSARTPAPSSAETTSKRAKRQSAKRIVSASGDVKIEPPPNWEEVYNLTANMRSKWLAPVDTMGCESLAEETRPPEDQRLQTLVSLMLSSQTKDTVTAAAMRNLQQNLPGGFTLESLLQVEPAKLNELIGSVGFHNNKTKFIKQTAQILKEKYNGDIPDTIEGMVSLPGVGPKMAYLCMSAAWGRDEGIGVDVHVHRITNLWGWHKTKTPEETRAALEAWLPKEKWHDINHLLVGFGQTWCPPVGRKCHDCELGQKRMCPSAVMGREVKKVKKEVIKKEDNADGKAKTEVEFEVEVKEEPKNEDGQDPVALPSAIQDIEDIGR